MEQLISLFKFTVLGTMLNYAFSISSGGILLSLYFLLVGMVRRIRFYEKLCLQCVRMSFLAFLIFGIFETVMILYSQKFFTYPFNLEQIKSLFLNNNNIFISLSSILISVFLFFVAYVGSKKLIKFKAVYTILVIFICVFMWGGIYLIIQMKSMYLSNSPLDVKHITLNDLLIPKNITGIFLFWYFFTFSIAISGTYLVFYLLLRRNRDDFGRDYYKFAISNSARWVYSYFFAWVMFIGNTYFNYNSFQSIPKNMLMLLGIIFLLIVAMITLGGKLSRSTQPLRLKELIVIKPVLALIICGIFVFILLFEYENIIWG